MNFKNFKISQKLSLGFGLIILFLVISGIWSVLGISDIVENAEQVILGNKLDSALAQKEIDHLNWANQVNALLTDDRVTSLDVETDDHQCRFGQWLYGEERRKAEELVPELKPLFAQIEEPHRQLHASAKSIQETFRQPHSGLALKMANLLADHYQWTANLSAGMAQEASGIFIYQNQVRNAVDLAFSIVKAMDEDAHTGDLRTRQARAAEALRKMRYGTANTDYFWINDLNAKIVMHPYKPELEGRDMSGFADPDGKKIFLEFVKVAQTKGEGFVTYLWPMPGSDAPVPKISYVRLYKPWNWVIGTGVYIDHTDAVLLKRAKAYAAGIPFRFDIQMDLDQSTFGKFISDPDTLETAARFPALKSMLMDIQTPYDNLYQSAETITDLINQEDMLAAMQVYKAQILPALERIKQLLNSAIAAENELRKGADRADAIYANQIVPSLKKVQNILVTIRTETKKHVMTDEAMVTAAKQTRTVIFGIIVIAILVSVVLTTAFARVFKKPIQKSVAFAQMIAGGDLTGTIDLDQEDEIGTLAKALTGMAENLKAIMRQLIESTTSLTGASDSLSTVSKRMAAGSDEMSVQAAGVAATSEEVSASVATVAAAAEQSSSSVSNIAAMTEEMSSTFANVSQSALRTAENTNQMAKAGDRLAAGTNTIAAAVEEMSASLNEVARNTAQASRVSLDASQRTGDVGQKMDGLVNASKQIGKVVGMIKDIADQTNMLALNATIEAAGAGEAGKGFAVVAGEVKTLAKQSADATDEIAGQIETIQNAIRGVVTAIAQINDTITEIADINQNIAASAEEQTATAGEISTSVSDNAHTVEDMADKANESAKLVTEIAGATDEVSKTATEAARHVEELANAIREVAQSAGEGARGVKEMAQAIQGIEQAAKETAAGANQTHSASIELSGMAAVLSEIVSKFKIK